MNRFEKTTRRARIRTSSPLNTSVSFRQESSRPVAAYRQRGKSGLTNSFNAPELWHDPLSQEEIRPLDNDEQVNPSIHAVGARFTRDWHRSHREGLRHVRFLCQSAGKDYHHPVTVEEVETRLAELPNQYLRRLEVVQCSRMTKKRSYFPCYGMQWGNSIYLYPIEDSLVEIYRAPPHPQQMIEARMYGGRWEQQGREWRLIWTPETIRDFYLNNVLIHEVGHINDRRNTSMSARERYANWFAIEYGYRHSRKRT